MITKYIYCSPYSATNLIYPFPLLYIQLNKSISKKDRKRLSTSDISYLQTKSEYSTLIRLINWNYFQFEVYWITPELGEVYGLRECEYRGIQYLNTWYGTPNLTITNHKHSLGGKVEIGNVLYHWLKKMYLERYSLYFDYLQLPTHEGRLNDEHLEIISKLKVLPDFYRTIRAAHLCYMKFRKKPYWGREYSR